MRVIEDKIEKKAGTKLLFDAVLVLSFKPCFHCHWTLANSVKPDQMTQNRVSSKAMHCLLTECTFKT